MARNIGIKHSPGVRYIAILDDDAYPFPNWLEELVKASRLYPGEVMQSNEINPPSPYFNFKKNFDDFTEISTANFALFPIEVFSTVGLYDEKLIKWGPVEVDFSIRLRKKGFKIRYCRHALIVHKYMPRTLTRYWKGLLMFFAKHPISGIFLIMCYTPIIHNFWDKYINQNPRFEI
jgi:GT2 family glycosyltransferase